MYYNYHSNEMSPYKVKSSFKYHLSLFSQLKKNKNFHKISRDHRPTGSQIKPLSQSKERMEPLKVQTSDG